MRILSLILVILSLSIFSNETIEKVKSNLEKIDSYSAELDIKVDISYVNIPDKKGEIFYKKPNKMKLNIEGLSMVPKVGVGNVIGELLSDKTNTYIESGEEVIKGKNSSIIKVLPTKQTTEIVLATIWIDKKDFHVVQAEITTKKMGTFFIEFENKLVGNIAWLPVKTTINSQIPKMAIPKTFASAEDKKKAEEKEEDPDSNTTSAVIIVKYSNYKLNQNIPDSKFD